MKSLSAAFRVRLVRLLGMLGSEHAGEVANAGSLADRLLKEAGLTWEDVVQQEEQPPPYTPPPYRWRSWQDVAEDCLDVGHELNQWELDFLENISQWRGELTPKQRDKLFDIAARVGVREADRW